MATDRRGGWGDLRATGSGGARSDADEPVSTDEEKLACRWLEFTFLTRANTTDADVVGSFHPMVLHPPSHDMPIMITWCKSSITT